jgi:hypothetical protein
MKIYKKNFTKKLCFLKSLKLWFNLIFDFYQLWFVAGKAVNRM